VEPIAALLDDKAPPVQALAFSSVFHALSCLAVPSDRPNLSQALQVAALRALVSCGEQGQLHAADVCRLAAQGDDRTPGVELSDWGAVLSCTFSCGCSQRYAFQDAGSGIADAVAAG